MPESKIQREIIRRLKFHPDVLFYTRMQSGRIGGFFHNTAGTPDLLALIKKDDGNIVALFLEVKRSGVKRLRYEQRKFFRSMEGIANVMCVVINDVSQLNKFIKECKNL